MMATSEAWHFYKNNEKETNTNFTDFLPFAVHKTISGFELLNRFYWEYLDAPKMLSFVKIGIMQNFCQWAKLKTFLLHL